jgi:hypothetical protein
MNSAALATTVNGAGSLIGIPSLTILLLHAINEIRTHANLAPAPTDPDTNPDALTVVLQMASNVLGDHLLLILSVSVLFAAACWLLGRELKMIRVNSFNSRQPISHPCLSVSIRG